MNDPYRVAPTVAFQDDVERHEEHIIERALASNTSDEMCIFRFRDALEP